MFLTTGTAAKDILMENFESLNAIIEEFKFKKRSISVFGLDLLYEQGKYLQFDDFDPVVPSKECPTIVYEDEETTFCSIFSEPSELCERSQKYDQSQKTQSTQSTQTTQLNQSTQPTQLNQSTQSTQLTQLTQMTQASQNIYSQSQLSMKDLQNHNHVILSGPSMVKLLSDQEILSSEFDLIQSEPILLSDGDGAKKRQRCV